LPSIPILRGYREADPRPLHGLHGFNEPRDSTPAGSTMAAEKRSLNWKLRSQNLEGRQNSWEFCTSKF